MTALPDNQWNCQFVDNGITVDVTVRIGLDWWRYLGGEFCFIEVFTALIRACINSGLQDDPNHNYTISDLGSIVEPTCIDEDYNVSLLQRSQLPWLFLMARHFCDSLTN
ncbi:MAG: hypothetical protein D3908_05715 [Candidatus Electrothrix sp. AUS4]|nr:hypothetical protein [Candidatus Electrothrix sp. AUS4]